MRLTPKIALVIDALPALGGAEKVLLDTLELFPDAPIYTLIYQREAFTKTPLAARQVFTSFIDRLPGAHLNYRKCLPLMPHAIQQFDLRRYDLVISFSYAVAHGVRAYPGQQHFSYTHTPLRYAWSNIGLDGAERKPSWPLDRFFNWFKKWDKAAVAPIDRLAAISEWVAYQVRHAYERESRVIYPPVAVERFSPQLERGNYYIAVNRLVAHKRVDLMVQAFNRLGWPLLVVGEGPLRVRLEHQAMPNIRFLGFQSDERVADLLGRARAYVCTAPEDFGIAVVEAQAAGCPVIAYRKGGALETVVEGLSGLFFNEPTPDSLADAVATFECRGREFDPHQIAASVQRFNKKRFLKEFADFSGVLCESAESQIFRSQPSCIY